MTRFISRKENRIVVRGRLPDKQIRSLCETLYDAIEERKYPDVTLDFSHCERVFEAFMLPLLPLIVNYREQKKINFNLILPQEDALQRLFKNANWAHYINPSEYEQSVFEGGNVPALQYQSSGEQSHLVDRVTELVLRHIEGVEHQQLKAFEWSLGEITDNVLQHAQSPVGGFVQATVHKDRHQVEFVVADCGRGIPASLGMFEEHSKSLQRAIEEGVTRDSKSNAGNGLYGSYRVAVLSKGSFEINSYKGYLLKSDKGRDDIGKPDKKTSYAGTSVRCRIDFKNPTLLQDALRLGDKIHTPLYDYIERRYGAEGDESARISLAEHRNDVSSREGGKRVRTQLENLLNSAQRIIIDFDNVSVISSSFADEVFGRLFVKLGPRNFFRRIEFQNTDETADVLIDRAIIQRTQTTPNGNGDNERQEFKMQKFTKLNGIAAPLNMINIDTDMIIPKQFLKTIEREGLGKNLFDEMRYGDDGSEIADFVLNKAAYRAAQILVTGENFGCGSSREHAPWALLDFGIRCVIAPSFADIFYNNCFKNGILPIILPQAEIDKLHDDAERGANATLSIDLEQQIIKGPDGGTIAFEIDALRKNCLLKGLDDIALTLQKSDKIDAYEALHEGQAWR